MMALSSVVSMIQKAILIPFKGNKILIQDRTGHKPPPWGFFGGSIEEGETPIEGLIRETLEELSIHIKETEVELIKKYENSEHQRVMYVYLWEVNIDEGQFELKEGKGMRYVDLQEAKELLTDKMDLEIIDEVFERINQIA
ncbi:NUDIX domain-containing protein [Candidatus Dojkabacteria bacterium]|nr:NUDIX domain-containing protein [Candidatus Dojkabacteria bacterium]